MKRSSPQAFTLIEMVTVVAVIVVLAGLVISVSGFVQTKAAREKALTQMKNYTLQCEAYKLDNGGYPQNDDTDKLDPRKDVLSTSYIKSCLRLYSCLSGDFEPAASPDNQPESDSKVYYNFRRDELAFVKDGTGGIATVLYIQDPFGNCFGYSTAGNVAESDYREQVKKDPSAKRPSNTKGYNPTFDLWSTGGGNSVSQTGKWIKNWGN